MVTEPLPMPPSAEPNDWHDDEFLPWGTDINGVVNGHESRIDALEAGGGGGRTGLIPASDYTDPANTDCRAGLQAALDAAGAGGYGGILLDLPGTYTLATDNIAENGVRYCLTYKYHGLHIYGLGAATTLLVDTGAASAGLLCDGGVIAAGPANHTSYSDYPYFVTDSGSPPTIYPITGPVLKGAGSVTLATAGNAANFNVGDWISIRTGQTIDFSAAGQPDAEINRVAAKPGGGVLTLYYPTQKRYAQEYYVSGTSGRTTTASTANAAPLGVQNLNDRLIHNVGMHHVRLESVVNRQWILGGGIVGLSLTDIQGEFTGGASFMSMGGYRDLYMRNIRLRHQNITTWVYGFSADSGCSNVTVRDFQSESDGTIYAHFHEGPSNLLVEGLRLRSKATTEDENLVSIRGRVHDLTLKDYQLQGGGDTATIYVDVYSGSDGAGGGGGLIGPGIIDSPNALASIVVNPATGWTVSPGKIYNGTPITVPRTSVIEGGEIQLGAAGELTPAWGSDTLVVNHTPPYRAMTNGVDTYIGAAVTIPADWQSFDVWVATANMGADTTGTYTIGLAVKVFSAGDLLTESVQTSTGVTVSTVTQNAVVWSKMAVTIPATPGSVHALELSRLSSDTTIANAVGLFQVVLRRSA